MLAQSGEPFDSPDFLYEVKWDGTRCLGFVEGGRLTLVNRREIEMGSRYPELACMAVLPDGTVLDGEVVVLENGLPNFNKLQQRESLNDGTRIEMLSKRMPATYVAFDQLYRERESLMNRPLVERREALAQTVAALGSPHVIFSQAIAEHGVAMFREIERQGLEGIMAKRASSRYQPGKRSEDWLKIKVAQTGEFDVIGFTQREGEDVVSALLLGERAGRRLVYKGKVGSGFTEKLRAELYGELAGVASLDRAPSDGPADAQWRDAGWRCRVRYFEKTATGKLRSPVLLGRI